MLSFFLESLPHIGFPWLYSVTFSPIYDTSLLPGGRHHSYASRKVPRWRIVRRTLPYASCKSQCTCIVSTVLSKSTLHWCFSWCLLKNIYFFMQFTIFTVMKYLAKFGRFSQMFVAAGCDVAPTNSVCSMSFIGTVQCGLQHTCESCITWWNLSFTDGKHLTICKCEVFPIASIVVEILCSKILAGSTRKENKIYQSYITCSHLQWPPTDFRACTELGNLQSHISQLWSLMSKIGSRMPKIPINYVKLSCWWVGEEFLQAWSPVRD